MAILWQQAPAPFIDPNGAPYSGAKAYFFDAGTTTPRTVYNDADLGVSHQHPVVANGSGMFPPVFLPVGDYRLRVETAAGATLWDVDGISTPAAATAVDPDAGDTDPTLLARTGDLKDRYDTGGHSGWVRLNGRSIGNAASGASERASADCEALFLHLWAKDSTLDVPGGRGGTAAGDWAANKRIALPDARHRARAGLGSMGADNANLIGDYLINNGRTNDTLGAKFGAAVEFLTTLQMPWHNHGGGTTINGGHSHQYQRRAAGGLRASGLDKFISDPNLETDNTTVNGDHNHGINGEGGGQAHNNTQPSMLVTTYIKL